MDSNLRALRLLREMLTLCVFRVSCGELRGRKIRRRVITTEDTEHTEWLIANAEESAERGLLLTVDSAALNRSGASSCMRKGLVGQCARLAPHYLKTGALYRCVFYSGLGCLG